MTFIQQSRQIEHTARGARPTEPGPDSPATAAGSASLLASQENLCLAPGSTDQRPVDSVRGAMPFALCAAFFPLARCLRAEHALLHVP